MTTPTKEELIEELDAKFTLVSQDGGKRRLPQHDFVMSEIEKALTRYGDARAAEGAREVIEQIKRYGKEWGSGASEKLFNDVLDSLATPTETPLAETK